MPEANEREKILRLILQKHCRESVHCDCAVDRALLEVETLMHVPHVTPSLLSVNVSFPHVPYSHA